jgi:hypothetical protein
MLGLALSVGSDDDLAQCPLEHGGSKGAKYTWERIQNRKRTVKSGNSVNTNPDWMVGFGDLIHLVYCNLSRIVD